jgi:hypothetical protein
MGWRTIKRGAEKQWVEGKTFRLADEVRYMQRRAAQRQSRIVTIGQLVLFSTETGDAWLLDPSDQLAAPLARDGDPLSVEVEETDTSFTVAWRHTKAFRLLPLGQRIFDDHETESRVGSNHCFGNPGISGTDH